MSDGMTFLREGNYTEAIAYFQRGITDNPQQSESYLHLGTAFALTGNLSEAIAAFHSALQINPHCGEAYSNLGVLFTLQGQPQSAINCYQHAKQLQPHLPEIPNNLGLLQREQGELEAAAESFRQALQLNPHYLEALNNLGLVLIDQKNFPEAITHLKAALHLKADYLEAWNHLGIAFQGQKNWIEAAHCFQQVIQLDESNAIAYNHLGSVYKDLGKPETAIACYRQALEHDPDYAEAHRNLALLLTRQNAWEEALQHLETALRLKPDFPEALNNLGIIYKRQVQFAAAQAAFEKAIELRPNYTLAHKNLADILLFRVQFDAAIPHYKTALQLGYTQADAFISLCYCLQQTSQIQEALHWCNQGLELYPQESNLYQSQGSLYNVLRQTEKAALSLEKALQLQPEEPEVYYQLGGTLLLDGQTERAREVLQQGFKVQRNPNFRVRRALSLPIIVASTDEIDQERDRLRRELEVLNGEGVQLANPVGVAASANFYLAYHGRNDRPLQTAIARFYQQASPHLNWIAPHCQGKRPIRDRLRVGICSQFLRGHTIGKLFGGILGQLPRESLEVILLRLPDSTDEMGRKISSSADSVIQLSGELLPARQQIADQELDLLFYPDIGMDGLSYFLAFSRLAPVQCMTWGHPCTTGIPTMDYFLSADVFEKEEAQDHYSERLIRLKHPGIYFQHPTLPSPARRESFDLPSTGSVYLCPQSSFKLHPEFDAILGDILRRDPTGFVVMLNGISPHWDEQLKQRWEQTIPDVCNRICFVRRLSYEEYLQLLMLGDVMLDPIHFGGGNTSLEAFGVGLPIVTWPGDYLKSRLTSGFYQQMNLLGCVAQDAQNYAEIAHRLALDIPWRNQIRQQIRDRKSVLYENQNAIEELTRFFRLAIIAYDCQQTIQTWR